MHPGLSSLICEKGIIRVLLPQVAGTKWEKGYKVFAITVCPVSPTALGSVGGWPCSCFTDEDLALKITWPGDFPGGPMVKTSPSNAGGAGSIPGQGAKIPHASGPKNQNIKQKQ